MTGAITSRPVSDVEPEDLITYYDERIHHADAVRSQRVTGGQQQLTVYCQDCRTNHVWELPRTFLITVQRIPR